MSASNDRYSSSTEIRVATDKWDNLWSYTEQEGRRYSRCVPYARSFASANGWCQHHVGSWSPVRWAPTGRAPTGRIHDKLRLASSSRDIGALDKAVSTTLLSAGKFDSTLSDNGTGKT